MQRKCVQSQRRCLPANSTRNVMTSGQGTAPKTQRVLGISTGRGPFHPPALLNKSSPNMRWAHTSNVSVRRLRQEDEEFRASHKARPFQNIKNPLSKKPRILSAGAAQSSLVLIRSGKVHLLWSPTCLPLTLAPGACSTLAHPNPWAGKAVATLCWYSWMPWPCALGASCQRI